MKHSRTKGRFGTEYASPRPWRIEYTSPRHIALVKGADGAIVLVCHVDNAELIVLAVNAYCPTAGHVKETKPQRIECPPDLQAARADSDGE